MAFTLNKSEILKDIIEVKKTSTGETYTNLKINIGSIVYKINQQTEALNEKLADLKTAKLIEILDILDTAQEIKCEKIAKSKINSGTAVVGLMLTDITNIKHIEELIIKSQKKGTDRLNKTITEWLSLHSEIILCGIHINHINELIEKINSLILGAITKFERIAYSYKEDTLVGIFWNLGELVEEHRKLSIYETKYGRLLLNNNIISMNDSEIEHTNKILNSEWFTDTIDTHESGYYDLRGTTLKVGKSLEFPTKQRYVLLSIIEDVWKTDEDLGKEEIDLYTSKLKSIAIKFKEVHGQIIRDVSVGDGKKNIKLTIHQYYFEIPTDRLNIVDMIRNLIYCKLIVKAQYSIERIKKELEKQLKYI